MGKSKKTQLRKTLYVEGMTHNRAQNPGLSALYKHPKISLLIYSSFPAGSSWETLRSRKPLIECAVADNGTLPEGEKDVRHSYCFLESMH